MELISSAALAQTHARKMKNVYISKNAIYPYQNHEQLIPIQIGLEILISISTKEEEDMLKDWESSTYNQRLMRVVYTYVEIQNWKKWRIMSHIKNPPNIHLIKVTNVEFFCQIIHFWPLTPITPELCGGSSTIAEKVTKHSRRTTKDTFEKAVTCKHPTQAFTQSHNLSSHIIQLTTATQHTHTHTHTTHIVHSLCCWCALPHRLDLSHPHPPPSTANRTDLCSAVQLKSS